MFKKLILISILFFFSACATKVPITWQKRIEQKQVTPLPLVHDEYGKEHNRTLLFLHGFGESRHTWRFLVPKLSQKYHLVMLDLKGFGDSPKIDDEFYSVYDQAQYVLDFIKKHHLKNITLVGRSYGGGIALVLALMQEKKLFTSTIEQLILINSMSYKQGLPSMLKILNQPIIGYLAIHLISNDWMAEEGYRYAFYNDDNISKESIVYSSDALSQPLAKYAYQKTIEQILPDDIEKIEKEYRKIRLKTLILWGREDVSLRVHTARKLHHELKNSFLVVFPHVGHMPQEEVPNEVIREILKFIEE